MEKDEEYELVPVTPIRRLEKEIEKLKKEGISKGYPDEITEILKGVLKSIEDLSRSNRSLFDKISSMVNKLDKTNKSLDELISMLKEASEAVSVEKPEKANKELKHLRSRFEDLLDQNRVILDRLDKLEESLKIERRRKPRSFRF